MQYVVLGWPICLMHANTYSMQLPFLAEAFVLTSWYPTTTNNTSHGNGIQRYTNSLFIASNCAYQELFSMLDPYSCTS